MPNEKARHFIIQKTLRGIKILRVLPRYETVWIEIDLIKNNKPYNQSLILTCKTEKKFVSSTDIKYITLSHANVHVINDYCFEQPCPWHNHPSYFFASKIIHPLNYFEARNILGSSHNKSGL